MATNLTLELLRRVIVDSRRSYAAETAKGAVLAAKAFTDGNHTATRIRVVDYDGTVVFDQPVTEVI